MPEDLFVSLVSNEIVLARGKSVTDATWSSATAWWAAVSLSVSEQEIVIPILAFALRRLWLRNQWVSRGLTVGIGKGVVEALNSLEEEKQEFELRLLGKVPTEAEVDAFLSISNYLRKPTRDQVRNIISLLAMKNGANFSVPGAGKTSTQLIVGDLLKKQGKINRMLVVCPKSSFEAWENEPTKLFADPPTVAVFGSTPFFQFAEILIVNFEQIERKTKLREIRQWCSKGSTLLVVDEAHRIKGGASSVRWQSVKELATVASRVDILTGTPMPQGMEDLRNLLSVSWGKLPSNYLTDAKLQSLRPWSVFVRTTKNQLDLPPVTIERITLDMGPIQKDLYSALGRNYQGLFSSQRQDRAALAKKGRAIFTLLSAASNPALVMKHHSGDSYLDLRWPPQELQNDTELLSVFRDYARLEMPSKYEWLAKFVAASAQNGRKVLIWSTFVGNLRAIERLLKKHNPAVVHGGIQGDDRVSAIEKFRHDPTCHALISNPQTLGEGISLHEDCHDAVFVDRSFNAGHYLQALDRIHRLGLPSDQATRVYLLESKGTIDTQVDLRLTSKIALLASVLDDNGLVRASTPSDEDVLSSLEVLGIDDQDLDAIFEHLNGKK